MSLCQLRESPEVPQTWSLAASGLEERNWRRLELVGRSLFVEKGTLSPLLKLWWHPPPNELPSVKPSPEAYHHKGLLLWMPCRVWKVDFHCPHYPTPQSLRSKGVYDYVRLVVGTKDFYCLAGEYMDCKACSGYLCIMGCKVCMVWKLPLLIHCTNGWLCTNLRMLAQLPDGVRAHFPVVLTQKYACNQAVQSLLHGHTLGSSPTALWNNLKEVHSEEWLRRQLQYLTDCDRHKRGLQTLSMPASDYQKAKPFPPFPTSRWENYVKCFMFVWSLFQYYFNNSTYCKWFHAVYVRDNWHRLPALLATATSWGDHQMEHLTSNCSQCILLERDPLHLWCKAPTEGKEPF